MDEGTYVTLYLWNDQTGEWFNIGDYDTVDAAKGDTVPGSRYMVEEATYIRFNP